MNLCKDKSINKKKTNHFFTKPYLFISTFCKIFDYMHYVHRCRSNNGITILVIRRFEMDVSWYTINIKKTKLHITVTFFSWETFPILEHNPNFFSILCYTNILLVCPLIDFIKLPNIPVHKIFQSQKCAKLVSNNLKKCSNCFIGPNETEKNTNARGCHHSLVSFRY